MVRGVPVTVQKCNSQRALLMSQRYWDLSDALRLSAAKIRAACSMVNEEAEILDSFPETAEFTRNLKFLLLRFRVEATEMKYILLDLEGLCSISDRIVEDMRYGLPDYSPAPDHQIMTSKPLCYEEGYLILKEEPRFIVESLVTAAAWFRAEEFLERRPNVVEVGQKIAVLSDRLMRGLKIAREVLSNLEMED